MRVAIYVRESGTRKYIPASPRAMYSAKVTFCLRYSLGGKRRWEQLDPPEQHDEVATILEMECGNNLPFLERETPYGLERFRCAASS